MYDTSGSHSVCYAEPRDYNIAGRLSWLSGELARQEAAGKAPTVADEGRALRAVALGNSLPTAEAYAWFGTLLGLFPPFAIFARIIAGVVVGGVIIARVGAARGRATAVPFGPFLALGALVGLFAGDDLVSSYQERF